MIIRLVKLTFHTENIDTFLAIFNDSKDKIAAFEGCEGVKLIQDVKNKNVFFTYSNWKSEVYLDAYRNSQLFKSTWEKTKILFSDKPVAWSTSLVA